MVASRSFRAPRTATAGLVVALVVATSAPAQEIRENFFIRADSNSDGVLDMGDALRSLNFLFASGQEPGCLKAADVDDTGELELTDAVSLLGFLFLGDGPPASPHLACGLDLIVDDLTCKETSCVSAAASSFTQYQVFDNGKECAGELCFDLTARAVLSREEIPLSSVEFDYLVAPFNPISTADARDARRGRRILSGQLQDGPRVHGGDGRTLIVFSHSGFADGLLRPDFLVKEIRTGTAFEINLPGIPRRTILPVTVVVENLGETASGTLRVELLTHQEWTVDALGTKQTRELSTSLSFNGSLPQGFLLTAVADPANEIRENLETNNRKSAFISGISLPDQPPVVGGL